MIYLILPTISVKNIVDVLYEIENSPDGLEAKAVRENIVADIRDFDKWLWN